MSVDTGMKYDGNQVVSWASCIWAPKALRSISQIVQDVGQRVMIRMAAERPKLPDGVEVLSIEEHNFYKALGRDYRYKKWSQRVGWLYW